MSRERIKKTIKCEHCKNVYTFEVSKLGLERWEEGEFIQDALPELEAWKRELLLSGCCHNCFTDFFGENIDEEEYEG